MSGVEVTEEGDPCTLLDCPPGLFLFGGTLGFKTEYGAAKWLPDTQSFTVSHWPDAYVAESGEAFWGGTSRNEDRANLMVRPIEVTTTADLLRERDALREERDALKREVAKKDNALHARNTALDGMAWVWCNGGCPGGVFRFTGTDLTEEMLALIIRNTERLKTWVANRDYRALAGGER